MATRNNICGHVGVLCLVIFCFLNIATFLAGAAEPIATEQPFVERPAVPYVTLKLVRDRNLQRELRLSRDQVRQVEAAIAEVDLPLWVLRDVPLEKSQSEIDALLAKLRGKLQGVLSSEQMARLNQVVLQARGAKALLSPDVAESLKLSSDQQARIRTILTSAQAERPGDSGEAGRANHSAAQAIFSVLSAEQTAAAGELRGKPFDLTRVLQIGCQAPELRDVHAWINTEPLTIESQRGKVVAVHFWAFGCINCIRNLPHYQTWYDKFSKSGLTIIGLQTPETEQERDLEKLRQNVSERKIEYPVAFDAQAENWKAWGNHLWPSVYLIDKQGRVRYWWYGELNWEGATGEAFMRQKIAELLAEK